MLPWRPAGGAPASHPPSVPGPQQPHRPSSPPPDSDSDEPSAPPASFFANVREIYPESTRRDHLKAWDLSTRDNNRPDATEEDRVQAAILKMDEVLGRRVVQPGGAGQGSALKRTLGGREDKRIERALFLSDDDEDHDSMHVKTEEVSSGTGKPGKKRRIGEGKGKARAVDLVLSDDDDDDMYVFESSSNATMAQEGKPRQAAGDRADPIAPPRREARPPTPTRSPLAQLLQLLPDLLPSHAEEVLASPQFEGDLDRIMDHLLSVSGGYPKVVVEGDAAKAEEEIDWGDVKVRQRKEGDKSALYKRLALDQLYTDFPLLPTTVIKQTYLSPELASSYFAPAYLSLYTRSKAGDFDQQLLKNRRKPTKKVTKWVRGEDGVGGQEVEIEERDDGLEKEMEWVKKKLLAQRKEKKRKQNLEKAEQAEQVRIDKMNEKARKAGRAQECQCCFDEVALEYTAACEKGHLFCHECAIKNASHQIGDQKYTLPCMTDCDSSFSPRGFGAWLPNKMKVALERLQADKESEMAFEGVEGFEKCPFCSFAMYIENENERLFRCLNKEECGKVSCRKCRKEGHVPLSCEEADQESRMGGVHAVEDAMAEAMIRSCPKCKLRYFKGEACNKITCSKCGTLSCYVCGVIVKDYNHFDQSAPGSAGGNSSKCPMFDDTEMRHFNEVEEARKKAQASLDSKTAEYAEKLAADKPDRQAPRHAPIRAPAGGPVAAGPYYPYDGFAYQHHYAPPNPAARPRARRGGRQTAVEREIARQTAEIEAMNRQQQAILQQHHALQQALQLQAVAAGGYAGFGGDGPRVGVPPRRVQDPQYQPPPRHGAQPRTPPAPVNPDAARQARLEAVLRRMHQG
ncbi:hypothetical protein JCM11491_004542 [Sporobolomyces phaffii]